MTFIQNIKDAYGEKYAAEADSGDLVQTLIIMAGFAIAAVVIVLWLTTSLFNRGADTADCIEGSNTFDPTKTTDACTKSNHSEDNSYKNDNTYKTRYGNG